MRPGNVQSTQATRSSALCHVFAGHFDGHNQGLHLFRVGSWGPRGLDESLVNKARKVATSGAHPRLTQQIASRTTNNSLVCIIGQPRTAIL